MKTTVHDLDIMGGRFFNDSIAIMSDKRWYDGLLIIND